MTKLVVIGLVAAAFAACSSRDDNNRCETAVGAVTDVVESVGPAEGKEKVVIGAVRRASIETCEREGLTPAQYDCIMAVKSVDALSRLGECQAIAANRPSWLRLPSSR